LIKEEDLATGKKKCFSHAWEEGLLDEHDIFCFAAHQAHAVTTI
jgi:hypothetical protein